MLHPIIVTNLAFQDRTGAKTFSSLFASFSNEAPAASQLPIFYPVYFLLKRERKVRFCKKSWEQ